MATGLQYKAYLRVTDKAPYSGGYPGEDYGPKNADYPWEDAPLTGSETHTYWYSDSDTADNNHSIKVEVTATTSWSATINHVTNIITVNYSTIISKIDKKAVGTNPGTNPRIIRIYNSVGGQVKWGPVTTQMQQYTVVPSTTYPDPIDMGSGVLVLTPNSSSSEKPTIYYKSAALFNGVDHSNDPLPSDYVDAMGMGISFRNTLPTPTTYSLNYNANGGSGAPLPQTTTTGEGSVTFTVSAIQPNWGSYIFLGWSNSPVSGSGTMADVDYEAGDTITLQEGSPNKTIYAVWEKDYRPGKILDNNLTWQSHNRSTGADNIRTASSWQTMRTQDGGVASDNPPTIAHSSSSFKNMRKIGANS